MNISSHSSSPSPSSANAATSASDRRLRQWLAIEYPHEFWYTVAAVIGFLALINVMSIIYAFVSRRPLHHENSIDETKSADSEKGANIAPAYRRASIMRRIGLGFATTVNIVLYRWALPLRRLHHMNLAEGLITLAYVGGILAWSFARSKDIHDPKWWANRAGILCSNQIPFIVALAGKNNVVSFLTGLSHEKLDIIHRVAGRAALITAWIHAGGRIKLGMKGNFSLREPEMQWGVVAIGAFTLATILSLRQIRNMAYEVFLIGHIIFIFLFMLGIIFHMPYYQLELYVWPGFLLWGLDRLLRAIRLIWLNAFSRPTKIHTVRDAHVHTEKPGVRIDQSFPSTVERLSADTVRLSIRRSRNALSTWKAGQHFFIILPGVSVLPWEAHPFTPASVPMISPSGEPEKDVTLEFIIRARDGFTKRLLEHAVLRESVPSPGEKLMTMVDGPYGVPPDLKIFDVVVLIAGGSGVSYTLSMFLDLLQFVTIPRSVSADTLETGSDRCTILSCFTGTQSMDGPVRVASCLYGQSGIECMSSALGAALSDAPSSVKVDVLVCVTRESSSYATLAAEVTTSVPYDTPYITKIGETEENAIEEAIASIDEVPSSSKSSSDAGVVPTTADIVYGHHLVQGLRDHVHLRYMPGRPNLKKILEEEASVALSQGRNVSVDVSGPSSLADEVRDILAASQFARPVAAYKSGASVTLHTETFGW